ncbi:MAG TPA: SUF system NifU family Fe-S cluster assembly protein [Acetobacteraceae bacterium]|nr:SUF system NifU family Fe-S cluster assembly protein [Acetobacteraceae bacterium]
MMFDAVRDLYSAEIRRHGRTPEHSGRPEAFDVSARGDNPMCGDRVTVFVRRDGEAVGEARFEARGCEISIASADLMCEAVQGETPDRVRRLADEVEAMARTGRCEQCDPALEGVRPLSAVHEYPSRVKCVTLPWRALIAALEGGKEATSE